MHQTPDYPEYPDLLAAARRAARDAGGFWNPRDRRDGGRYDQILERRNRTWLSAVTGIWPLHGWRHLSLEDCELLAAADTAGVTPATPDWMVQAELAALIRRAESDAYEAERARVRRLRYQLELDAWHVVRDAAAVALEVYENPTARARNGVREQLGHAVPAVDCYSGIRKTRKHRAYRALCESETRPKPLRLEDSPAPDAPVTCVRCLAWATKVRTSP